LNWLIDDVVVRTLNYGDAKGGTTYPQTPMQIKLGTWVGGLAGKAQGIIDWAGGLADFSKAPFVASYQKVQVINYSNGHPGAGQYVYGDKSGTFGSIKIEGSSGSDTSSSSTSSSITSSTTTSSASKTTMTSVTTSATNFSTTSTTSTTSAATNTPTNAPGKNAAGKATMSLGNVAVMGAVLLLGALAL
jgi:beta-glucanase (GH16 family)